MGKKDELKNRLQYALDIRNKKAADLSKVLDIPKSALSQYLNGKSKNMTADRLNAIGKYLNVSEAWLMGYDVPMERTKHSLDELSNISTPAAYPIPILGTICAGNGVLCEENFQGFFFIDRSIKADFCLNVHGDSMTGSQIFDGDKAFIRKTYDYVNGKIYAVRINDETEAVLKRVFWYADQIVLNSSNPDYEPIIVKPGDVSIIGEYVGVYHPAE